MQKSNLWQKVERWYSRLCLQTATETMTRTTTKFSSLIGSQEIIRKLLLFAKLAAHLANVRTKSVQYGEKAHIALTLFTFSVVLV